MEFTKHESLLTEVPASFMSLRRLLLTVLLAWAVVALGRPAAGQELCRGDVNDDGVVDADDAAALPAVLFNIEEAGPPTLARADANEDGMVSAADVVALLTEFP